MQFLETPTFTEIIYYWDGASETFYMLYAYRKSEQEDMTPRQLRLLRQLVEKEFE